MKTLLRPSIRCRIPAFFSSAMVLAIFGLVHAAESVSIRFLPIHEELVERKIGLQDGKGLVELDDLNHKKRSRAYRFSPGDAPPILVALDRERPGGIPLGVDIILPAGVESPLVLILPDPEHRSGMRVLVLEDDVAGFPWGGLRFVNTVHKPYMVRCDKETVAIGESPAKLDLQPGGEARNIGVQILIGEEPDKVLYSAVWEHNPNLRKLIFIMAADEPDAGGLNLEIVPQDKRAND